MSGSQKTAGVICNILLRNSLWNDSSGLKISERIRAVTIFATFGKVCEHCISECEYRASPGVVENSSKPTAKVVDYKP